MFTVCTQVSNKRSSLGKPINISSQLILGFLVTLTFILIQTESIRKSSNFNFQWTKILYQNNLNNIAFFFTFFKGYRYNQLSVITPKTHNFSLEPRKIIIEFHKNCENIDKILQISCVRCHFLNLTFIFSCSHEKCLWCYYNN